MTVPKRFGVLRFVAAVIKVIAWIVLIVGVLFGIVTALNSFTNLMQTPSLVQLPVVGFFFNLMGAVSGGIILGVFEALGSLVLFVLLYALAELVFMYLAVEENTRLTAALLLRMHQESQPDTRATTYSGGYSSEPFEG